MVAFNLAFDWDQALLPEYTRFGVQATGQRGFCALTLACRTVGGMEDYKLDTLKERFGLNVGTRSHQGRQDVETTALLFEQVMAPALHQAEIYGFAAIAEFSRKYPVGDCLKYIEGDRSMGLPKTAAAKTKPTGYYLFLPPNRVVGPHSFDHIREWLAVGAILRDVQVCQEGTEQWVLLTEVSKHDFVPATVKKRIESRRHGIGWRAWEEPVTRRQMAKLAYFEIPYGGSDLSKGQASELIDCFTEIDPLRNAAYYSQPADADQVQTLRSAGLESSGLTRLKAKARIDHSL